MFFNTIDFVIFFIVVLTTLTAIKNRKFQHVFLLLASYFFFYCTSNYLIVLLIFTTVWDYYFGSMIYKAKDQKTKKVILLVSLAGNLGLLGFFKYADFAITQFNFLGNQFNLNTHIPMLNLALPIAISFYTFHSITYTVGIYRGQLTPVKSFTEYAIFVTFFPQLVAGPILRAKEFLPQLREKIDTQVGTKLRRIVINETNLKIGITIMALGFLKKMFFADNIAPMVNHVFNNPVGADSFTIILGTIAFGIQIYCDFSGYSDIAIGAALIMGFKIPKNFDKPFFATSPANYWNRWHISLSHWVRDYLYYPLVFKNRNSIFHLFSSTMIVMFILGLWHGAGVNYILFGIIHGFYLGIHLVILHKIPSLRSHQFFKSKIGFVFSVVITQYLIFFAFIAFRVSDLQAMMYSMQKYIFLDFHTGNIIPFLISHKLPVTFMILFLILHLISYKTKNLQEKISRLKTFWWMVFLVIILTSIIFFYDNNPLDFIYFRF